MQLPRNEAEIDDAAPKLNGEKEGTFVHLTIRDRWPKIVTKVVDHMAVHRRELMQLYGDDADADVKSVVKEMSELKYMMMTDKTLEQLCDDYEDVTMWNNRISEFTITNPERTTWYKLDWLFVECYLYRRIFGAFWKSKHLKSYDVFAVPKNDGFNHHVNQIRDHVALFDEFLKNAKQDNDAELVESTKLRRMDLETLLKMCLWGNRADLSLSAGEHTIHAQSADEMGSRDKFILCNDIPRVVDKLMHLPGERRVDMVLDNAGAELMGDLILAEYLVASGLATKIVFHCKAIPWFVSDVTKDDWTWTLQTLSGLGALEEKFVDSVNKRIEKGTFVLMADGFWTSPLAFYEITGSAPALYAELSKSNLIFFKGDLNYRKLTGDRDWSYETPFQYALRQFLPAPLVALRTLKAETVVGLDTTTVNKILSQFGSDNNWLITGEYAVVQMAENYASCTK